MWARVSAGLAAASARARGFRCRYCWPQPSPHKRTRLAWRPACWTGAGFSQEWLWPGRAWWRAGTALRATVASGTIFATASGDGFFRRSYGLCGLWPRASSRALWRWKLAGFGRPSSRVSSLPRAGIPRCSLEMGNALLYPDGHSGNRAAACAAPRSRLVIDPSFCHCLIALLRGYKALDQPCSAPVAGSCPLFGIRDAGDRPVRHTQGQLTAVRRIGRCHPRTPAARPDSAQSEAGPRNHDFRP